jgi:hypothetical protein
MSQHHIEIEDLKSAHLALLEFVNEFELLYYQRRPERIHFVHQSIHALTHLAPLTGRRLPCFLENPRIIFSYIIF